MKVMRNKFIPLIVALVFGSVAAVGFSKMMKAGPQVQTVEVYVAARAINPAEEITQDAIKLEHWPAEKVPEDAIQDWKAIEGKFAAQRIFAGEMVVGRKLLDEKDSNTISIPRGYNVVTIKADEANSVGSLVAPGDRVNVIGFFTKSDIIPATTTRTILSGIKVFAVDGRTTREETKEGAATQSARTVSLLIHSGDAEAWTLAKELAKISLSLGRPDEGEVDGVMPEGPNPAGQEFLAWLSEYEISKNITVSTENSEPVQNITVQQKEAPAVPTKPAVQHQMVKIGADGRLSVYTWEDGNPVPVVTGNDANPEATASSSAKNEDDQDLGYLNGSDSPLYSDPSKDTSVGVDNYNPFRGMQGSNESEPTQID
jgi:pilus assembly protein CpaB